MKTKLLIILACICLYIPTAQSQCTPVANQNTVAGTVFNDVNQNGIKEGAEPGVSGTSVDLYQDNNGDGIIDSDDVIVASTTSDGSGNYSFVIAQTTIINNVLDEFNSISYTNNNGSENWTNNWQEIGESNGVNSGNVRVVNNKLRIGANTKDNRFITGDGVDRIVDLSTYTSATLSFDFDKDDETDSEDLEWYVRLQISTDGTNYTTLENFYFTDAQTGYSYDISAYISATTHIRFVGSGEQEKEKDDWLHFDNIDVSYSKLETAFPNYIAAIDASSIANGSSLTTASFYPASFTSFGEVACNNNFGLYFCGPNCNPIAEDDNVTILQGESITIAVLDNDSDGDGNIDIESLIINTDPTNGSISIDDFGNIIYSPNGNFIGTDFFVYEICDETLITPLCDTATVTITVIENYIDPCLIAVEEQIFYIPYSDDDLRTAFINASSCSGSFPYNEVNRIISIKSPYPGAIITYDHWEDGYEADINNPTQSTTLVWGDKDITNGTSPKYSDDFIPSGGDIVLENAYNFNPRGSGTIVYDGKDKIHTSRDVAISTVAGDIDVFDFQLAKTDVYSIAKFGTSFVVPFGEDLGQEFQYTSLFIRAANDATLVNVDLDNDGNVDDSTTLNEGEVMFIDGGVNSGATISSNKEVGVDLFFGGLDCVGTRQINILPGKFNSDTYYSPVPTVNSNAPAVVYFYNSLSRSINIDWSTNSGSGTITVAAKSSNSINLSVNAGYKFQSQGGESYVASQVIDSDASGSAYDWAFNLISETRLTDFTSIAWAPGSSDDSANYNPVWVTPTANTTVYIKYDGNFEDTTASTSPCGIPYDQSVTLNALNYTKIFDTDNDQSGLSVFTCDGTKIFAVFGQDASVSPTGAPAMDVGTTMQPLCLNPLVFANDDKGYGLIDTPIDLKVSSNDTAFLSTLNLSSISTTGLLQPENGLVEINANGKLTYTPNSGFVGVDSFEYSICALEFPNVCDVATVYIKISNCASPANKNIIYGQVYFDFNEDTVNNDGIGVAGIDVNIYNDINNNGAVDSGDILLNTVTTNKSGFYDYQVLKTNVAIEEDFSSSTYSGGTGWSTNWTEVNDDGNPSSGVVQIQGSKKRLLVRDNSAAYRSANLSGVTSANISFDIREYGSLESSDDVVVQICSDNTFSNCQTIFIKADDFNSATINAIAIDADKLTSTTTFRIQANGYTSSNETLYIDNIILRYEVTAENFVMETDLSSFPAGYTFSTDNVEVANFTSGSTGNCEQDNDFGVLRCNLTESGLVFNCNDNGTPLDTSDDTYVVTLDPDGTRLGGTYTVSGDLTGIGTYGTPLSFGPFLISDGDKVITLTDNTGNCMLEDIEITVSQYACINLNADYTIDFDGVDDYLESNLDMGGYSEATVMAWVKLDPAFSQTGYVISYGDLIIEVDKTRLAKFRVNNVYADLPSDDLLELDKWYHMALIFDSSLSSNNLKVYLNGVLKGTSSHGSLKAPIISEAVQFNIGKQSTDQDIFFKGCIDEVRVFDIALSEDQMQKIINQEIQENAGTVAGAIIPKSIVDSNTLSPIPWANLKAYYPMTEIISGVTTDFSGNNLPATLYNITTIQEQTAPMPYITSANGAVDAEGTWLHGDVWNMEALQHSGYAIIKVEDDVTINSNLKSLGLVIDQNKTLTVQGENMVENNWYLELNGTIDLSNDSQLIQSTESDLVTSAEGKILRRQEGNTSVYWYNYWASPVGGTSVSSFTDNNTATNNPNNSTYRLNMLKDGNGSNMLFTSAYHQIGKISTYWLYTYKNGITYWDWASVSPSTTIAPGVGYTQKGTGNAGLEQQYIFEGKPNNGTILVPVVDSGGPGSVPAVSKTDYLLGNPYPSALDIHKFIDDNIGIIDGTLQLWQQWSGTSHNLDEYDGGYAQVNKLGSVRAYQFVGIEGATNGSQDGTKTPSKYLPVGQGFMTEIVANGNIEFNNGQRVFVKESDADGTYDNGSIFFGMNNTTSEDGITVESNESNENNSVIKKIRLEFNSVNGPATRRELLLGFSDFTSDNYDYGYDSKNTEIGTNDLNLVLGDEFMTMQAYGPITNEKVVSLALVSSGAYDYSIKMTDSEHLEDQPVYLKDNLTGTFFDLTKQQAYNFSTDDAGEFNERFDIVFQKTENTTDETLGVDDTDYKDSLIYFSNQEDKLFIKGLTNSAYNLKLISMLGQTVKTFYNVPSETLENGLSITNLSTGSYIVYFRIDGEPKTKQIIID